VFAALSMHGLEPVAGQREVCSAEHRLGTAADLVCHSAERSTLVLVELKTGYSSVRSCPARDAAGNACRMRGPLRKAVDCILNRHLAQLAVTMHLFAREKKTLARLGGVGVEGVEGVLLYVDDSSAELYRLDEWWSGHAARILNFSK
jgi:hypothetical protein